MSGTDTGCYTMSSTAMSGTEGGYAATSCNFRPLQASRTTAVCSYASAMSCPVLKSHPQQAMSGTDNAFAMRDVRY
eukprot:63294-Rhodomonas_salina.2